MIRSGGVQETRGAIAIERHHRIAAEQWRRPEVWRLPAPRPLPPSIGVADVLGHVLSRYS
eukprot:CAMPEP_0115264726 /NCGR_PEP_ID=MMETSP0270-20121206/50582_1 /TAXON_ID=71861 /ORGANISM="Scrippsiella trochoidea, Strain CCMP3099" /LENGTH=59 /DNA_ID=CAMNT_0002680763 /DNA_START=42 /DNA_END=221 /DNA_ORIENTATION=+